MMIINILGIFACKYLTKFLNVACVIFLSLACSLFLLCLPLVQRKKRGRSMPFTVVYYA